MGLQFCWFSFLLHGLPALVLWDLSSQPHYTFSHLPPSPTTTARVYRISCSCHFPALFILPATATRHCLPATISHTILLCPGCYNFTTCLPATPPRLGLHHATAHTRVLLAACTHHHSACLLCLVFVLDSLLILPRSTFSTQFYCSRSYTPTYYCTHGRTSGSLGGF